eukprot:TRINITY_DN7082_c0_g1_i2.p2 TRINITY_DN7082_c0_g1~~TRINITY_DN7082_c0_g1_i2.p2  ORF type:complete len:249 (+),score=52.79 TRINITY_DN7082_c0_g1_i2:796-1542(+)
MILGMQIQVFSFSHSILVVFFLTLFFFFPIIPQFFGIGLVPSIFNFIIFRTNAWPGHSLSSLSTEEERNSYAYKKHFLSLLWILRLDNGKEVAMVVDYYVCLKIVTIRTIAWNNINNDDVMQGNIVSSSGDSGLLVGLFPCDEGLTTPNLSNLYLFRKYRKSFQFSPPAVSGRPYLWLQALCGLNFSPDPSQSLLRRVQNANPLFQLFVPPSRYLPDKKSEVEDDAFVVRLLVRNLIEKIENHVRHKI